MARINLRGFTVLVVDKDDTHRWMINNLLTALGVGEVLTASSNEDAINMMKRLAKREVAERIDTLDFVISDLFMAPIDGIGLVRWIRMHPESHNRFLPAILMATQFEPQDIAEARGFGATHFLTKPVTVEQLADRILTVVNRPRPFVYNADYFGPDRRGKKQDVPDDRRDEERNDIRMVRSPLTETLERFPSDSVIRIFRPPNHLKRKAGAPAEEDALFTEGALAKAQRELDMARAEYADTAMDYVESLQRILAEAQEADDPTEHFARIHGLARQLGLQGEMFDYPLVSTVGNSLHRFTHESVATGAASLELVKVHVDSLTVVLRNRIAGDGGETGRELVSQLQAAIKKIAQTAKAS